MKLTTLEKAAAEYFISKWPEEAVVFIKNKKLYPVKNIHPEPNKGFLVSPIEYIEVEPEGIIHSHPNGDATPSELDIIMRKNVGVPSGIIGITETEIKEVVWL